MFERGDGDGNIVRSIDISGKKEYNYEYEDGRIIRATEADIELSGEIIQCTETHPFQVKGKGWIDACNLNPGDVEYFMKFAFG